MTKFGDRTPSVIVFKSESHKLAHSFPVKSGETVKKGQPVVLNTDGTIQGFKNGDALNKIIGYAINDSATPAYQASKQYGAVEVTVSVSGQAIINAVAGVELTAGPVKPTGAMDSTGRFAKYIQTSAGDLTLTPPVLPEKAIAIALNEADADGDLIQILFL